MIMVNFKLKTVTSSGAQIFACLNVKDKEAILAKLLLRHDKPRVFS